MRLSALQLGKLLQVLLMRLHQLVVLSSMVYPLEVFGKIGNLDRRDFSTGLVVSGFEDKMPRIDQDRG